MTGPWYITPTAVRELLAIKCLRDAYDGPQYEQCEDELREAARTVATGEQQGRPLDSGATQYRGPRPLRLRLTVAPPRPGQPLPQLVRVQPDHEGRRQAALMAVKKARKASGTKWSEDDYAAAGKARLVLRIDQADRDKLESIAAASKRSLSAVVAEWIRAWGK